MNKKVSIIIPAYNSEKTIKKCIESVSNQSYQNMEIIIVNDGSTDETSNICKQLSLNDKRIFFIEQNNQGGSGARNTGIKKSTGEFILFLDSDDWIEKDAVKLVLEKQKEQNYDIVMFEIFSKSAKVIKKNFFYGEFIGKDTIAELLPYLIKNERINSPCNKLYRSSLLINNKFDINIDIGEDALFNYGIFFEITSLYILSDKLYHYESTNNQSLTQKYNSNKFEMLMYVSNKLNQLIVYTGGSDSLTEALEYIRIKNTYSCLLDTFLIEEQNLEIDLRSIRKILLLKINKNRKKYNGNNVMMKCLDMILGSGNYTLIYTSVYLIRMIQNLSSKSIIKR